MNLKKLILSALFIALSFVGANIKIAGTIAFDSLPAFLGALLLGPAYGAAIGFCGHLFSSLMSGFPFGPMLHGIIAVSMAITMVCFAFTHSFLTGKVSPQINYVITSMVGTVLNGPIAFGLCYPFLKPLMGHEGSMTLLPVLTLVSLANIVVAVLVYISVHKVWSKYI